MRAYTVTGIVLKRTNFGEKDRIITLFTRELGKVNVVAKGVRRITSRRAPHLELFNLVRVTVHQGKNYDMVTEAKLTADFAQVKNNLYLVGYLFYIAEVVDKLLPEQEPHEAVWKLIMATVEKMEKSPEIQDAEAVTKEFVVRLIWELGFLPKGRYPKIGVTAFVEHLAERNVKSRKFIEDVKK